MTSVSMDDAEYVYRTIDSNRGLTVVNGVRNTVDHTENVQTVIDGQLQVMTTNTIVFDGGNLGKYIHKMKIAYLTKTRLPIIAMISHHFDDANMYIYGIDANRRLKIIGDIKRLHDSKLLLSRMDMGCRLP